MPGVRQRRAHRASKLKPLHDARVEAIMGKYFVAWLLGVPALVLVLIYFFF